MSTVNLVKEIRRQSLPLRETSDLTRLINRISPAKVVLLGEATHGTHDFYFWRRIISERLITDHGFRFIAVEGDWPSAQQINKRLLLLHPSASPPPPVADVLKSSFTRWPTWMWANTEIESLLTWMRDFNATSDSKARIFGLDVYSLFESAEVVVEELAKVDADLARRARELYECFDVCQRDEERYVAWLAEVPEGCRSAALRVVAEVFMQRLDEAATAEETVDIRQNAKTVRDAEQYYRALLFGEEDSWNVREKHMMDTLALLVDKWPQGKGIVWAHNTHVGDYRATTMANLGQVNIGGLTRQRYGADDVALVGFGSYEGSVVASYRWGGPMENMVMPRARKGSYEEIFNGALREEGEEEDGKLYVVLREKGEEGNRTLEEVRGHRAIGVVYNPEREGGNYVPTSLSRRYDAFVFINRSRALEALPAQPSPHQLPEGWPTGL